MLDTKRIAATSVALFLFVVMTGCTGTHESAPIIVDENPFVSGCNDASDAVSCANFSDVDLGNCGTTLGFGLVDSKCVEIAGCEEEAASYCLYETLDDCLLGCGEDSALGEKAIGFLPCDASVIEGNLNPNWCPEWGDTDPACAYCDILYVCYEEHEAGDPEVETLVDLFGDEVPIFKEEVPFDPCPEGTENWNVVESIELDAEAWSILCSYSLLEDTRQMRCYR